MREREGHPWDVGFARTCDLLTGAAAFGLFLSMASGDGWFGVAFALAILVLQVVRP